LLVDNSKRNSRAVKDSAGGNRKTSAAKDSQTKQREVALLAHSYPVSQIRVCSPSMKLNTSFRVPPFSSKHESCPPMNLVKEGSKRNNDKKQQTSQ